MSKSISVIIPTYNYGRFIGDAIRSVFVQTQVPDEIIVVDDGSTDDTAEIIKQFGESVLYLHQNNAGVCAARNFGVARSTGELLAFLDADDIWEPTKLEEQALRFANDESVGLVHCGMREFDGETGETICLKIEGGEGHVADKLLLWESPSVNVSGSVVMISRKAFETVGGFDTQMKVGEDWDLCYRIAKEFKAGFVPEPLVNYRRHGAAAHRNVPEMEKGMSYFYEKAFSDPSVAQFRRRAYGAFHKVMAGSYFHSGEYGKFLAHSVKSIWMQPTNLIYFFEFPRRYYSRKNPHVTGSGTDA